MTGKLKWGIENFSDPGKGPRSKRNDSITAEETIHRLSCQHNSDSPPKNHPDKVIPSITILGR